MRKVKGIDEEFAYFSAFREEMHGENLRRQYVISASEPPVMNGDVFLR